MTTQTAKQQTKTTIPRKKVTYIASGLPAEGFCRLPQIVRVLGISKNTFLSGVKSGRYPAGILLSPRTRVWSVDSIRQLIEEIKQGAA